MAGSPAPPPFRADDYRLAGGIALTPPTDAEARALAATLAPIEPWLRYGVTGAMLLPVLAPSDDGAVRLVARTAPAAPPQAVVVVRDRWLAGPYVQFLAVLPQYQGRGLGTALLAWFEAEARRDGARNAWICVSAFNEGARRLYSRAGFEITATIDDLLRPGIDEVLMRKRLYPQR